MGQALHSPSHPQTLKENWPKAHHGSYDTFSVKKSLKPKLPRCTRYAWQALLATNACPIGHAESQKPVTGPFRPVAIPSAFREDGAYGKGYYHIHGVLSHSSTISCQLDRTLNPLPRRHSHPLSLEA